MAFQFNPFTGKLDSVGVGGSSGGGLTVAEEGTNANGSYIRYSDGTQVCWKEYGVQANGTWTFPAAFSVAPTGVLGTPNTDRLSRGCCIGDVTPSDCFVYTFDTRDNGTTGVGARLFAIGTWE